MFNSNSKSNKSPNSLIQRYIELRELGKNSHTLMMKDPELDFMKFMKTSARYLGMLEKINGKETFVLEDENSMDILADFTFFEYYENGKNFTELYYEKHKSKLSPTEVESFEAKINHFTSFFELIDVDSEKKELMLRDLLYPEEEDVIIIDINYSKTAAKGSLMFARIIPFEDLNMTSGFSFPFYKENKNKILNEHKLNMKRPSGHSEDMRIYKSFYQLYPKYGIPVLYKDAR